MNYIDIKKLYATIIVLYCRVSTAGQDILKQISLAEAYLRQNNIKVETVKQFIDNDVSANKKQAQDRPAFQQLLAEIKTGNVGILLVENRDRLARNFYEHVELVKILHQYKVQVIFTDPGHYPFSDSLAVEALYGIFPQITGRNIASRTEQTRKRYPNALLGFNVIGKRSKKRYEPNPKIDVELKSFFYDVMDSPSAENLLDIFIKYKKLFKKPEKALDTLQNPFYAGHFYYQDDYISLPHVDPIISIKDYLLIQEVLKKYKDELSNAIQRSGNNGISVPICYHCKKPMYFRSTKLGESGNYVCSKNHPKLQIAVTLFNELIQNHLLEVLGRIQAKEIKKDVFQYLLKLEKYYKQELSRLQNQLNSTHQKITNLIGLEQPAKLESLIKQDSSIKERMIFFDNLLKKINHARKEIDMFADLVCDSVSNELYNYELDYLSKLLFHKIEVSPDALIYHMTFGNYIEGNDLSNEY